MENEKKICLKCGLEQDLQNFRLRNKKKNLRRNECKKCYNKQNLILYYKDKNKFLKRVGKYRSKNIGKIKLIASRYRERNTEKEKNRSKQYKIKHP